MKKMDNDALNENDMIWIGKAIQQTEQQRIVHCIVYIYLCFVRSFTYSSWIYFLFLLIHLFLLFYLLTKRKSYQPIFEMHSFFNPIIHVMLHAILKIGIVNAAVTFRPLNKMLLLLFGITYYKTLWCSISSYKLAYAYTNQLYSLFAFPIFWSFFLSPYKSSNSHVILD